MIDQPPVSPILVDGDSSPRSGDGHAEERSVAPAFPIGSKAGIKRPHFAITPSKLREALFYRWKLALAVGLIFASVGAGVAWLTYKPNYTATAIFQMSSSKPRLIPGTQSEDWGGKSEEVFQRTQVQMLRARVVLEEVLKKDEIRGLTTVRKRETPMVWLEKELQGSFIGGTDIFRISLSGEDPEEVAKIVNMVKDVFFKRFVKTSNDQQADRFANIEDVVTKTEVKIKEKRNKLRDLADMLKTGDTQVLTLRQRMALEEYGSMKREETSLETEIRRTDALLAVQVGELKTSETEKIPPEMIEEYLDRDAALQQGKFEVVRLEAQIKEYRKVVTGSSPRLAQLEADLKSAAAQLQKVRLEAQPDITQKVRNYLKAQRLNNIAQAEEKLKVLGGQKSVVSKEVEKLGKEADRIGRGSFDIESQRNEIEEAETILKKLRGEKERLEIEKNYSKPSIASIQDAEVPTLNQASLLKTGGLYAVAGLVLGFLGVSYLEARLHRVHKPNLVPQELGIQTLGVLPLLAHNAARTYGQSPPANESVPDIMFSDAVDRLCARLLCDDRLGASSVIMVTSATENEGKTMLATQLAAGLARSGRKTLLVDCDFRNPRCHEQFGLAAGPGLSEVLCGEAELANVLHPVPDSEARILPAGRSNPQVIKALHNGHFAALLARLRLEFDCIIVDSAPTPIVSDGLLIGKLADGVILVVRPKVSKAPAVFAAYEQLEVLKIRILGAVVNADPARASGTYYK